MLQSKRVYPRVPNRHFFLVLMQRKYAILLDGGFLKRKLGSQKSPMSAQNVVDFTNKLQGRDEFKEMILHRIYYYDAEPLSTAKPKPLTGGQGKWTIYDFSKNPLYSSNKKLLDDLKKEAFFAVRLGEVQFRGWSLNQKKIKPENSQTNLQITESDLVPNIQQKGVDMRIGLDIASLSLKNHADIIALVAGDSDFIPALKFARREGKQIFLYTLGNSVLPEIYAHTDITIEKDVKSL